MTEKRRKNLEKEVQAICAIGLIQCLLVMAILMGLGVLAVFATLDGGLTVIDLVCILAIIPIVIFILIWLIIRRVSKKATKACCTTQKAQRQEPLAEPGEEMPMAQELDDDLRDDGSQSASENKFFGSLSEKDFL